MTTAAIQRNLGRGAGIADDDNQQMSSTAGNVSPLEGAVRLADWGVIAARGEDARKFLHGQLTQDIEGLPGDRARLAGYCSPKGRLLATFVAWTAGPDEVRLACSADLLAATLKRLSMFVLRARCKLVDASGELALFGLAGRAAQAFLGADAPREPWGVVAHSAHTLIRLPEAAGTPRWLLVQAASDPAPALPTLDAEAWRWLEVQSGVPRVVAATAERFVPQMVNLEVVGGVHFQKGCYPGQEVVARSQYRGTLKRRAFLFEAPGTAAPGTEVFSEADPGQPAGMVAAAAAVPGRSGVSSLLVETKLVALDGDVPLRLGGPDGVILRRTALPYAIPSDT
jgi:hypothetical protein